MNQRLLHAGCMQLISACLPDDAPTKDGETPRDGRGSNRASGIKEHPRRRNVFERNKQPDNRREPRVPTDKKPASTTHTHSHTSNRVMSNSDPVRSNANEVETRGPSLTPSPTTPTPVSDPNVHDKGVGRVNDIEDVLVAPPTRPYVLPTPPTIAPQSYIITVRTPNVYGAGTDAHVSVTLRGSTGTSHKHVLDSDASHFQPGSDDVFAIEAVSVGALQQLDIEHDNTGASSAWYCGTVEVRDTVQDTVTYFHANTWLADDRGAFHTATTVDGSDSEFSPVAFATLLPPPFNESCWPDFVPWCL